MNKAKDDLSKAASILLDCSARAAVLTFMSDYAGSNGCDFSGVDQRDRNSIFYGMSTIAKDIMDQVFEAQELICRASQEVGNAEVTT